MAGGACFTHARWYAQDSGARHASDRRRSLVAAGKCLGRSQVTAGTVEVQDVHKALDSRAIELKGIDSEVPIEQPV